MKMIFSIIALWGFALPVSAADAKAQRLEQRRADLASVRNYQRSQQALTTHVAEVNRIEGQLETLMAAFPDLNPSNAAAWQNSWRGIWQQSDARLEELDRLTESVRLEAHAWSSQDAANELAQLGNGILYPELQSRLLAEVQKHRQRREEILGSKPGLVSLRAGSTEVLEETRKLTAQLAMESIFRIVERHAALQSELYLGYRAGELGLAVSVQRSLCYQTGLYLKSAELTHAAREDFTRRHLLLCQEQLTSYDNSLTDSNIVLQNRRRLVRTAASDLASLCRESPAASHCQNLAFYTNLAPELVKDESLETSLCIELYFKHFKAKPTAFDRQDREILGRNITAKEKLIAMCEFRKPEVGHEFPALHGLFNSAGISEFQVGSDSKTNCPTVRSSFTQYIAMFERSAIILQEMIDLLVEGSPENDEEYDRLVDELNQIMAEMDVIYPPENFERNGIHRARWTIPASESASRFLVPWYVNYDHEGWDRKWNVKLEAQSWVASLPRLINPGQIVAEFRASVHDYCVDRRQISILSFWGDSSCSEGRCLLLKPAILLRAGDNQ